MGFFFKALAAIAAADAIDRHARNRPVKYWYPNQPHKPTPDSQLPRYALTHAPATPLRRDWDPQHPERP